MFSRVHVREIDNVSEIQLEKYLTQDTAKGMLKGKHIKYCSKNPVNKVSGCKPKNFTIK